MQIPMIHAEIYTETNTFNPHLRQEFQNAKVFSPTKIPLKGVPRQLPLGRK